jgi:hypothetical protein
MYDRQNEMRMGYSLQQNTISNLHNVSRSRGVFFEAHTAPKPMEKDKNQTNHTYTTFTVQLVVSQLCLLGTAASLNSHDWPTHPIYI